MARAASPYRRVPGRTAGLLRRDTLWLAPDHLLRVHSLRFTEEYRRFYLADIQAIVVQKRPRGETLLRDIVILAVCAGLTALPAFTGHPVWATLAGILLAAYALYVWRQADCRTWLQTAIGVEELPSLRRARAVRNALALVDPKIKAAQPAFSAEQIARAMEAPPPPLPFAQSAPAPPLLPVAPGPAAPSRLYVAGYVVLLALGTLKVFETLSPSNVLSWSLPAGYLTTVALLLIPLFRQGVAAIRGSRTWAVCTALGVAGTMGAASLRWAFMRNLETMQNPDVERIYSSIDRSRPLQLTLAFVLLALAVWGLLAFGYMGEGRGTRSDGPTTLFGADGP